MRVSVAESSLKRFFGNDLSNVPIQVAGCSVTVAEIERYGGRKSPCRWQSRSEIYKDSWNNLFKADLFQVVRYPEGRSFEDYFIKPHLLQKALKMVYTPDCLLHYRNRQNSLSKVHTLKSNVDYWQVYRERFDYLSPISEEYYRLSLTQAMGAIGRMWRWIGACSKEERRQAQVWLDEMQQFNNMHFKEIMKDPAYPRYTKFVCLCAKSKSSILFRVLYTGNQIYRRHRSDNEEYYS